MVTTKSTNPTGIVIEVEGKHMRFVDYSVYIAIEQRVQELEANILDLTNQRTKLLQNLELANKRLEPIEEWWERSNEYIRNKHAQWDSSMYEAIEQCMALKGPADH